MLSFWKGGLLVVIALLISLNADTVVSAESGELLGGAIKWSIGGGGGGGGGGANPGKPIFGGPGLKEGAGIAEKSLDSGIAKKESLPSLVIDWVNFSFSIVAVLAVVAIVWAGYIYIASFGDDAKVTSAKNILLWVAIGIVLVLASFAIVNTIIKGSL